MIKFFYSLFVLSILMAPTTILAQAPSPNPNPNETSAELPNKVSGLELPADQTINYDEGFVNIQAQCKGEVKWLVVSSLKVKFVQVPNNALIISVPPQSTTITIFAVGLVDGKQTEFARTNIQVGGAPNPMGANPNISGTNPGVKAGPFHVTFVVDMNQATPEIAQMLNSPTLRQGITAKGNFFRIYDIKSPIIKQKKIDLAIANLGSNCIVIQNNEGTVVTAQPLPKNEQEIFQIVNKLGQ